MTNYSTLLKDPRWQRKRLEILNRDNWRCTICSANHRTLNIHHKKYMSKPWDVDSDELVTVCESCHSIYEEIKGLGLKVLSFTKKYFENKRTYINAFITDNNGNFEVRIYQLNYDGSIFFLISITEPSLINHYNHIQSIKNGR